MQKYAFASRAGQDAAGYNKINCNETLLQHGIGKDMALNLFCLFDGSGPQGQAFSRALKKHTLRSLVEKYEAERDKRLMLRNSIEEPPTGFDLCHKLLDHAIMHAKKTPRVDQSQSGASSLFCLMHGRQLVIKSAGDVRCLVVTRMGQFKQLSTEHTCSNPSELHRLRALGATIKPHDDPIDWRPKLICSGDPVSATRGLGFTR